MPSRFRNHRVKELRLEKGWSQAELARGAGISRTAVSAVEGRRLVPSVAAALALAQTLGATVEDLFGAKSEASQSPQWAWPPPQEPCRYWQAHIGGSTLFFPVEPTATDAWEHDGLFGSSLQPRPGRWSPEQTLVLACCDPAAGLLASRLAQAAEVRLLVLARSSHESLDLLGRGLVHVAGVHLATLQAPEGNARTVREKLGGGFSLMRFAHWQEGLALAPRLGLRSVQGALRAKLRWVGREAGSGARQCLDELLGSRPAPRLLAHNHRAVAESIRSGWADAGVCLRLAGEEAGLRFFTLREEAFDLCFPAALAHDPRVQALVRQVRSPSFRRLLGELPGYDSSATGELEQIMK